MSVVKIIKNISGTEAQILNRQISNNSSYNVPSHLWLELAEDNDIITKVTSGLFVVNNGTSDLSVSEGISHIKRFQFDSADKISFSNLNYVSTNVKDAIIESKNLALARPRFTLLTTFNGTVSANQWLGYNELLPGNTVPIVVPVKCRLKEITFSWNSTISIIGGIVTITADVDGRFDLYKNGLNTDNIVFQRTFTNSGAGGISNNINIDFNAGDIFVGRWIDTGNNPSDAAICYFFEVIE